MINWDKSFEIGIPEIDEQHKMLVEAVNAFYDELADNRMNDSLKELMSKVMEYTDYHFTEEEKYMERVHYELINEQREMHNRIRERMADFKTLLDEGKVTVSMPITSEIKRWIKEHIKVEDRKIAELTGKG